MLWRFDLEKINLGSGFNTKIGVMKLQQEYELTRIVQKELQTTNKKIQEKINSLMFEKNSIIQMFKNVSGIEPNRIKEKLNSIDIEIKNNLDQISKNNELILKYSI